MWEVRTDVRMLTAFNLIKTGGSNEIFCANNVNMIHFAGFNETWSHQKVSYLSITQNIFIGRKILSH